MQLREAPWVLPQDKVAVGKHNKRYQGTAYELRLELRPEPFIGAPAAPVWLLNLNPGFDEDDLDVGPQIIARQEQGIRLENHSFWYLDPVFACPGQRWWARNLRPIIREYGLDFAMQSFFCAELYPYHSYRYRKCRQHLPSQLFTAALVRDGCTKGKSFIIMRARAAWMQLVPELENANWTELRNKRNPFISHKNLRDCAFLRRAFHA